MSNASLFHRLVASVKPGSIKLGVFNVTARLAEQNGSRTKYRIDFELDGVSVGYIVTENCSEQADSHAVIHHIRFTKPFLTAPPLPSLRENIEFLSSGVRFLTAGRGEAVYLFNGDIGIQFGADFFRCDDELVEIVRQGQSYQVKQAQSANDHMEMVF